MHSRWAALLLVLCSPLANFAQALGRDEVRVSSHPYAPPTTFHANAELVSVGVVVRDVHGHAIPGLKQEDFEVFDDGHRRAITAFSIAAAPALRSAAKAQPAPAPPSPAVSITGPTAHPRFCALFFDDIHLAPGDLAHAKVAARRFLSDGLAPDDRIAVFTSSNAVALDFTTDVPRLLNAVDKLQAHPRMSENGIMPCPRITPYQAYMISNNLDPSAFESAKREVCTCNQEACSDQAYSGGGGLQQMAGAQQSAMGLPTTSSTQTAGDGPSMIVRAQAQQTWDLARNVSLMTLSAVNRVVDYLGKQPGTRMLLLASTGFLSGTLSLEQDAIIDHALHSDVVINALDAKGLYAEPTGMSDLGDATEHSVQDFIFQARSLNDKLDSLDGAMANFAESTGGLLFRNNNDLNLGFREVGMVPEVTYLLGFPPEHDGKLHKLRVNVRGQAREFIQARPAYFAAMADTNAAKSEPSTPQQQIDREVLSSDTQNGVPTEVVSEIAGNGAQGLRILVKINVAALDFARQKDRRVQKLTFVAALLDADGNVVTGKQGEMGLALKDDSYHRLSSTGISAALSLQAPAGAYRLRAVVQESVHGKLSATTEQVKLP